MIPAKISAAAVALLAVSGLTGCAIFDAHRAPQAEHGQRTVKARSKTHHYAKASTASVPRAYKMKRRTASVAKQAPVAVAAPSSRPDSGLVAETGRAAQAPSVAARAPSATIQRIPGTTLSSAPISPPAAVPATRPALPSVAVVPPPAPQATPARISVPAAAIEAARALFLSGQVVRARAELQGMVASGDPAPVLELARTYDPHYLMQTRGRDASADVTRARSLYQEAAKKGSTLATEDMTRLGPAQ